MPTHPALHFFRRWLALCPCPWPNQSIPGVNNANQWGSYEQIDKKCPDLHQSEHADLRVAVVVSLVVRACYQQATARGPKKMSSDHETKGEAERILLDVSEEPGGSTRWRSVLFCELTRSPFGRAGRGLRHRVTSPSASATPVLICCLAATGQSRDGISADARPEKHDGCVDQAPACRARRLLRAGWSAIESPCHRRRSGGRRWRTRGATRANVFQL